MNEWQPIETAPKDGTRILLYCNWKNVPADPVCRVGYWNGGDIAMFAYDPDDAPEPCFMDEATRIANSEFGGCWDHPRFPATHWQPLPEPPK